MSRMVRDIEVGIKGAGGKMEQKTFTVPADIISGQREAQIELIQNDQLKKRVYVNMDVLLYAQISDPYDADRIAVA